MTALYTRLHGRRVRVVRGHSNSGLTVWAGQVSGRSDFRTGPDDLDGLRSVLTELDHLAARQHLTVVREAS